MFWSFLIIFIVCEFGERLSYTFDEIIDAYEQFRWYLFPRKVQHMQPILLSVAQRPVKVNVFGSISCGRITLRDVSSDPFEKCPGNQYYNYY